MSDLYVKKQVYECSKCGALLSSKEEFEKHYEKVHDLEKYYGAYVISKDRGDYVGKIKEMPSKDNMLVVDIAKISGAYGGLLPGFAPNVFARTYVMPLEELNMHYAIVPLEVAKATLEDSFKKIGYDMIRNIVPFADDFINSPVKEKEGGDDGN